MKSLRVLFVEDSEADVQVLRRELQRAGYEVRCERVATAAAMTAALDREEWDLVLADYVFPRFSGIDALRLLQERGLDLPFIIVTDAVDEATAVAAMRAGAHDYVLKGNLVRLAPAIERELSEAKERRARREAEGRVAILLEELRETHRELELAYEGTLEGWSRALDLRDHETEGHSVRVAEVAVALGRAMGLCEEELVQIRRGALLHDIGKMAIPDQILRKPGLLTEEQMATMRRHPVHACEMLAPIAYLRPALDIPYCHHERWDGTGYPRGLKGEQIPLAARLFAVVDVWDALRSDRPYRAAWPAERAREYIQSLVGIQFDPDVVAVFFDAGIAELWEAIASSLAKGEQPSLESSDQTYSCRH